MHEELEKLNEKIILWAMDRKILANGKAITQMDKTIEEIEELILAIGKYDTVSDYTACEPADEARAEICDAIGDIYTTLVVGLAIDELQVPPILIKPSPSKKLVQDLMKSVFLLGGCFMVGNQQMRLMQVSIMMNILAALSEKYDTTLRACVQGAYDEIRDRRGYLNEQGIFVKEST
jgi:hypothetical protein